MESRIRIKLGPVEVECEGSEAFIKHDLLGLIDKIAALYESGKIPRDDKGGKNPSGGSRQLRFSTGSVATKLGCNSGPDLVLAAAAHLAISGGKDTFTRQELLREMKTASAFYKKSYGSNLTTHLTGLVKAGKLNEPATGTYSLTASEKSNLETRLAKSS